VSAAHPLVDAPDALRLVLATTDVLLLDFDGPVCSIFAAIPAYYVASQLRDVLHDNGHSKLSSEVYDTDDPFDVLNYAAMLGDRECLRVETALTEYEVEAARKTQPNHGALELIETWHATGRDLAIVSNNSRAAIEIFLRRHDLVPTIRAISARTRPDPQLLKPNPFLIEQAVDTLEVAPNACTMIGDSLSDAHAANAAGTAVIGYANKQHKIEMFTNANVDCVITQISILTSAIRKI
jgi:phosphoglycolate phosphatase